MTDSICIHAKNKDCCSLCYIEKLRAEIVALKEEVGKLKEINNPKVKVDCAKSDYNDWRCR